MARLRGPEGCPWDHAQTPESLKPYIIEETYEVIDAIDAGQPEHLCEELGDLLLQVVFQAQIAKERDWFTLDDVGRTISDKMERRHPHVFGSAQTARTPDEVAEQWEEIKIREGKRTLAGVPRHLPALLRSVRVSQKAARVGFDWSSPTEVITKVDEELAELKEAIAEGNPAHIRHELGDLLFSLANLARHVELDPEDALRTTVDRFSNRFNWIEDRLAEQGHSVGNTNIENLELMWQQAKKAGL